MRWRNVLFGGGAAAIAGAAAYNVLAKRDVPELENLIGGDERWFGWRGWQVAYTVRGRGPAVLLVHGIHAAASSYEWRANVHELARTHTVYALDLLGFGRSSRPNTAYSARLYQALVDDFVERIFALETANCAHPVDVDVLDEAKYVQSAVIPAMTAVREIADKLERIVPDDLWPLPKYSEILFIK